MKQKKPKVPVSADDKEQSERFIELGILQDTQSGKSFEKMFKAAVPPKPHAKKGSGR